MFQNTDFPSAMIKFDWHKHRIRQHLKKRRLITAKQQHSVSEEKFEVFFLSHLFKVVKPLLTFLSVGSETVCLVRGLGSGVVWHGHSGENELLADSCCAPPGGCTSELE